MMRAFATSRRGRPKRVAANDNTPRDLGTAELQMKRAQLARGLDPVLAAHPLDLLLAKAWISEVEHRAGWRYAALYRRVIGRTDVSYGRFYESMAGTGGRAANTMDEGDLIEITQRFLMAKRHLLRAGRAVARTTERVSVFGVWPGWILAPGQSLPAEGGQLLAGLRALDDSLRGGCR
jgi:hypothetical protein